jgi:hypothetical protein
MKHTPGPWSLDELDSAGSIAIYQLNAPTRSALAELEIPDVESEANARLIAAAPELLDALENLLALVEGECPSLLEDDHHYTQVKAAIAKAKGVSRG